QPEPDRHHGPTASHPPGARALPASWRGARRVTRTAHQVGRAAPPTGHRGVRVRRAFSSPATPRRSVVRVHRLASATLAAALVLALPHQAMPHPRVPPERATAGT